MTNFRIAFYRGKASFIDKVICWYTRSPYSHCEIVFSDNVWFGTNPKSMITQFSSNRSVKDYDFFHIPMDADTEALIRYFCNTECFCPYDWSGIFFSQFLPFGWQSKSKWFCSELCVAALQYVGYLPGIKPHTISPGQLAKKLGM